MTITRPWVADKKKWDEWRKKRFEKKARKALERGKERERVVARTNERRPEIQLLKDSKFQVMNQVKEKELQLKKLKADRKKLKKQKSDKYEDNVQLEINDKQIKVAESELEALKIKEKSLQKQISLLYNKDNTNKKVKKGVKKDNKKLNALDKTILENYSLQQTAELSVEEVKLSEMKQQAKNEASKETRAIQELETQKITLEKQKQQIVDYKAELNVQIAQIAKSCGLALKKDATGKIVPISTNEEFEQKSAELKEKLVQLDEKYKDLTLQQASIDPEIARKKIELAQHEVARKEKLQAQKEVVKQLKSELTADFDSKKEEIQAEIDSRKEVLKKIKKTKGENSSIKIVADSIGQKNQPQPELVDHRIEMPQLNIDDTTLDQTVLDNTPLDDTNVDELEVPPMPGFEDFSLPDEETQPEPVVEEENNKKNKKKKEKNNKTKSDGKSK